MPAVISGLVQGPGGQTIANARIAFASAPVAVPDVAALTDSAGRFALTAAAPGTYVVHCSAEGYRPASVAVHVAGSGSVRVEIQLVDSK